MANTDFYDSLLRSDVTTAAELSAGEKLIYGVGSAVVAGGVSLVNSVGYLVSRPFSTEDDPFQDTSKEETVASIFGSDAATYYKENQLGLDLLGEAAASFIPGTLAVKGLRGLQGAKYLTGGYKAGQAALNTGSISTELSLGTWLRPTAYAENLTKQAVDVLRSGGAWEVVSAAKNKAIAAYAYQGALEGIAFEVAAETFLNRSTLYDKDSLAQTMLWNPLLAGSLGGIAGGLVGRYNVFAKGGLQAAKNDVSRVLDTATLGVDLTTRGRFAAEDIGILTKRADEQVGAIDKLMTGGAATAEQLATYEAIKLKIITQSDNLISDAISGSISSGSFLKATDVKAAIKGKSAEEIQGIFTGVRNLTNVTERDMLAGAANGLQDLVYLGKDKVGRNSAEFAANATAAELGDTATKAVSIKGGTKIYTEEEAAIAMASGETISVIRKADGSYIFPNGTGMPGLSTHGIDKERKTASLMTVEGVGTEAAMPVIMRASDMSMVSDVIYPHLTELIGVTAAKAPKAITKGGVAFDLAVPKVNELTDITKGLEGKILSGSYDYLDSEAHWIRLNKLAAETKNPGTLNYNAFNADLAYAETQLIRAKQSGVGEITLTEFGAKGSSTTMTVEAAEAAIAKRKQKLAEYLMESGASKEEIESHLKISINASGFEDIDKLVGLTLDEAHTARYIKAEVNVAKADAMLNGVMYSQRMLEESRGYQMLGQPLALATAAQHFGLSPDKFVSKLDLTAFGSPVLSPGGNAATLLTNSRVSASVLGAGQQALMMQDAAQKLAKEVYTTAISPTATFVRNADAVRELAIIRTLYSQRQAGGDLYLIESAGKTFVAGEAKANALADLLLRVEKQAAKGNGATNATVQAMTAEIDKITKSSGVITLRTEEAAAHLKAIAAANHNVEFASRPINSFLGKQTLKTSKSQVWFPSPDPLDNPFLITVHMPGMEGGRGEVKMFLADKATFESKKASLLAETNTLGSDMYGGKVLTTADIKRHKTISGEFEYSKDFMSAQFDNEMAKQGKILAEGGFDQKYFLDIERSLVGRWKGLAQNTLQAMYPEYQLLQKLHVEAAQQKLSTLGKAQTVSNRFDIDRQAIAETTTEYSTILDVMNNASREDRTKLPGIVNRFTQAAYDRTLDAIKGSLGKQAADPNFAKSILDNAELDAISAEAFKAGANVHAAQMIVAGTKYAGTFNPNLNSVISKINAVSNFFTLRLDAMHSVMNAASMPITALPHFRGLINEVKAANNGELTPALQKMLGISVGSDYSTLTGAKVFAQKAREFFSKDAEVSKFLTDVLKVDVQNYQHSVAMVDLRAAAFAPDATLSTMQKSVKEIAAFVKENRVAKGLESFADTTEAFTQYVAGKTGYDIALASGKSEAAARLFAAGFAQQVNSTINLGARHSFYSGPAGMLMGLYQNYMRGMITRSLQFIDEGNIKSVMELAGLQGAIFGARSLPLFDFYNRKLLGENNKQHADAFSAIYGANGQLLGDFIAYGAGSSLLGVNMFTRGDLTPMSPTLLPAPWDAPAAKTLLSLAKLGGEAMQSVGNALSGDVTLAKNNFMQAIEHNGINRPIGRMAAMLAGHSTTLDGKPLYDIWQPEARGVIGGLDLPKELSYLAIGAAGLAGTSALSEAVTKDVMYRMTAYQLKDKTARSEFSKNLRIELASGALTPERYADLTGDYIRKGGTPQGFSQIHAKASALGKSDPIEAIIKKDPNNNIYNYASQILGPQARMNPAVDAPVE